MHSPATDPRKARNLLFRLLPETWVTKLSELFRSRQPYRRAQALLDAVPDPSFAIDLEGRVFFWNQAMETLTGIKASEILGQGNYAYALAFYNARRPILIDCVGLPIEVIRAHYPNVRQEGQKLIAETETQHLQTRSGGFVSAIATPLYDEDGHRIGSLEQVRDETELRQAFIKITNLSLAVEQSPNGMVITDLKGNIEYVNEAFLQITGYTQEELIGQPMRMLNSGETPKQTFQAMWSALTHEQPWKGELINRRKNGERRVIFSRVSPIRQTNGVIQNYLAIQEDITERKQIGHELDRHRHHLQSLVTERTAELESLKEAAEAANEAKSAFLANMSHEIRTPMNGIIGLTRIVFQQTTQPEQRRKLGQVLETAQTLLGMINDILDISKIEAHKLSLDSVSFYLEPLLMRQLDLVRYQAEQKGLALNTEISPELRDILIGDPVRIGQVLLNFLGNAVKFTEHGSVTIKAMPLEILTGIDPMNPSLREYQIRFEVIDTGIGIPAEVCQRLFQSFEQGDVSITRKFGGTGLGLAISRRLAEMMGGEANVTSEEGKGSCFWFTIRVKGGQMVTAPSHTRETPENVSGFASTQSPITLQQASALGKCFPGLKILLVEDNEINQEVAVALFDGSGYTIEVAENGAQAVKLARANRYNVILMDLQMPVMDGLTATKQIRRLSWHQDTPIIAMTANAFEEDRAECTAAGMNAHISKPVSPDLLYSVIGSLLSRQQARDDLTNSSPVAPQHHPAVEMLATPQKADPQLPAPRMAENTSPPGDGIIPALAGIDGLDPNIGLASLGGRQKPYLRMLKKFALMQEDDSAALLSALQGMEAETSGRDDARRLAHSLKGVAGTLGMTDLKAKAAELETAIKENEPEDVVLRLGSELAPLRVNMASQLLEHLTEVES